MPEILSKHIKGIFNTLLTTQINILTILFFFFAERIPLFLNTYSKSYEQKRIAYSAIRLFYKLVIKKECPYNLDKSRRRKSPYLYYNWTSTKLKTLWIQLR